MSIEVSVERNLLSRVFGAAKGSPLVSSGNVTPAVGFESLVDQSLRTPALSSLNDSISIGSSVGDLTLSAKPDLPRGIRPEVLISQIKNTTPFLFQAPSPFLAANQNPSLRYLQTIFHAERMSFDPNVVSSSTLTHFEYFELCLSAHWATVGSFVPTDVDNLIRFRLWHPALSVDETAQMANLVLESYRWDAAPLCRRFVTSPVSGEVITGHQGEWFSVAVAAYGATRKRDPQKAQELLEAIQFEVTREAKVYLEMKRARDGIGILKASTLIAHNLGDLDRVLDLWGIGAGDPLYDFGYKAGMCDGSRALRFSGALSEAGRLNKALMAPENHRHLPLRSPKGLRRSADFLLPLAPFFDEWGSILARHPDLSLIELAEIVEALYQGWERIKGPDGKTVTYAYPRAVAGILENFPGGMNHLGALLPAKVERNLRSGLFRSLVSIPERRFEEQWAQMALNFVK